MASKRSTSSRPSRARPVHRSAVSIRNSSVFGMISPLQILTGGVCIVNPAIQVCFRNGAMHENRSLNNSWNSNYVDGPSHADLVQNLFRCTVAGGKAGRCFSRLGRRSSRQFHSFLDCRPSCGDRRKAFCRSTRSAAGQRGCPQAWQRREMGALARRRPVSSPLWPSHARGCETRRSASPWP